ncbi:ribonuclease P protein component [Chelativorans sp. ZYF759]|uniref:ribonuclease P protein component n=1 Tax=Chelativorans sp. ZYF759 TaxID=2692213 RepID=UPI00145C49BB|nr:ribonuclease P protein component [Chelativorans sp. ZYF759]NMG37635.1 ribonuclease P protein component [Chelativorans sp. ZYF759]
MQERPAGTQEIGRLTRRAEFLAARNGEKRRGKLFLLEVRDRKDGGPPRLGITVTRKVGNAVVRNRIRRRIREAVRQYAGNDMAAGNDYVVVGRNEVLDAPFETLKRELSRRIRGRGQGPGISDGKQP